MADSGDVDLEAFRAEAAAWISENFPESLKRNPGAQMAMMMGGQAPADADLWRKRMGEKGWGVPTWPAAYGGGGLSRAQARALQEEMAKAGAWNPIGGMGVMMFGPTLLEYGNDAQKPRHLPPVARAEIRWCQGFSEPGAGSDLASLQTRAERQGDDYVINGQKIWTSDGHRADYVYLTARTDPDAPKHRGISNFIIDLKTPGVTVRPIQTIDGGHEVNEVFFDDVKVPVENLVGEETERPIYLKIDDIRRPADGPRGEASDVEGGIRLRRLGEPKQDRVGRCSGRGRQHAEAQDPKISQRISDDAQGGGRLDPQSYHAPADPPSFPSFYSGQPNRSSPK